MHNGRTFDDRDIVSICRFGESTKKEDETAIGKFGIGFKSIFAYTKSPSIWSPTYNFKIEQFILPIEIKQFENLHDRTRFEFPFNHNKKPAEDAYKEINEGLHDLSQITLLFLNHIQEIEIIIDRPDNIIEITEIQKERHKNNLIEIKIKKDNTPIDKNNSLFFLIFSQSLSGIKGVENRFVDIAYEVSLIDDKQFYNPLKNIENQFKIVKPNKGEVSIYFPAKKESSKLRFHINGPFQSTPDRSSIKENAFNSSLFDELCSLFEMSFIKLKENKLLDRNFLNILPIERDELFGDYSKFQEKLIDIFTNNDVLPTSEGKFSNLNNCLRGNQQVRNLIGSEDLHLFYSSKKQFWALGVNQKNSRLDHLLQNIQIDVFDEEDFINFVQDSADLRDEEYFDRYNSWHFEKQNEYNLSESESQFMNWLNEKEIIWLQKFYSYLLKLEQNEELDTYFNNCVIIKTNKGGFSCPSNCYFYTTELSDKKFTTIHSDFFKFGENADQEDTKNFFNILGVKSFDDEEKLKLILDDKYPIGETEYPKAKITDIYMFLKMFKTNPSISYLLSDRNIIYAKNPTNNESVWTSPDCIFLDEPYHENTNLKKFLKFIILLHYLKIIQKIFITTKIFMN